ncbi:MAG TPA: aldo/keto reductase [Spirochaetia bacterium]|nr:aldo/keto reductase [Spirochaetia bacterium]
MRTIEVGPGALTVSELVLGCMRIDQMAPQALDTLVSTALGEGITFFDHADIYAKGKCEQVFGASMKRLKIPRESVVLQSKCGIRPDLGMFDFSKEHILASVDGILSRLDTDYLDVLLLHRPDALVEPHEVAEAFGRLQASGKVRNFGVSNQNPTQIELLQRGLPQRLLFNQLQLSVAFTPLIDAGIHVNNKDDFALVRDGGALDYCRLQNITVQAWSPFQYGFFEGVFLDNPKFPRLNQVIDRIAGEYQVTNTAVAVAWISRHPARIQTVLGTTTPQRVRDAAQSQGFVLTRQQWYEIYRAAGNVLP